MQKIVIVGGGFAGVWAALAASAAREQAGLGANDLAITLVSRDPYLTIRPRLHEASLDDVRIPLDEVLGPGGVGRIEGEVTNVDTAARTIAIADAVPRTLRYDRLVLAAGSRVQRVAIPGGEHAHSVDSYEDAIALERHLRALKGDNDGAFTAVVAGAGFTGIEVATTLVSRLRARAGSVGANGRARVVLVERGPVVARDLGEEGRRHVQRALVTQGIEVRTRTAVSRIGADGATLGSGEHIRAATVVCTGGLRSSELTTHLGLERDAHGRLPVDGQLRVHGLAGVYAAGDVARAATDLQARYVAPMSCQCAMPMGEVAGGNAVADLLGAPLAGFTYPHYVTCLDLGEAGALFMQGWERAVTLTGFWAKVVKQSINTRLIYPPRHASCARPALSVA